MRCRFCGSEIPDGAGTCPLCGSAAEQGASLEDPKKEEQNEPYRSQAEEKEGQAAQIDNPEKTYQAEYNRRENAPNGTGYLVAAILTTLLCCIPFGIPAIVYAVKINGARTAAEAKNAAKKARIFCIVGAAIGAIWWLIIFGMAFVGGIVKDELEYNHDSFYEDWDHDELDGDFDWDGDESDKEFMEPLHSFGSDGSPFLAREDYVVSFERYERTGDMKGN